MDIYKLDRKQMREALIAFGGTEYGRTIFLVVYFLPAVAFFTMFLFAILAIIEPVPVFGWIVLGGIGVFMASFLPATAFYYKELRVFVSTLDSKSKLGKHK